MNEQWKPIIAECEKLAKVTGIELPAAFENLLNEKDGGRIKADVWFREKALLEALTGFLKAVNKGLDKKATRRLSSIMRDDQDNGAGDE